VRVFELTSRELRGALFESGIELEPLLGGQVIVVGEQDFDSNAFGQLDGLVEYNLSVVDVSSERLHSPKDSTDRPDQISVPSERSLPDRCQRSRGGAMRAPLRNDEKRAAIAGVIRLVQPEAPKPVAGVIRLVQPEAPTAGGTWA